MQMTYPLPTDLLLGLLQFELPSARATRLRQYSLQDWDLALEQARQMGVLSLVAGLVLSQANSIGLPETVHQTLQSVRRQAAVRNMRLFSETADVIRTLQAADISVILLKGLHLAEQVYPDVSMRTMGDIDLLLHRTDIDVAFRLLEKDGFTPHKIHKTEDEVKQHHHLPVLSKPDSSPLELHWNIASPLLPLTIDLDGLWQRAQPCDIEGALALTLAPEDLLLHLSLHLFQDNLAAGLKRVYDIAQTIYIYQEQIQPARLVEQACQWRCDRAIFLALSAVFELLQAPVPQDVLSLVRPADYRPEIGEALRRRILGLDPPFDLHPDLAHLAGSRPLLDRLRIFWKVMFPYPEYVAGRYGLSPGSLQVYPYYLVRLFHLTGRYAGQVLRLAQHDAMIIEQAKRENLLYDWWLPV